MTCKQICLNEEVACDVLSMIESRVDNLYQMDRWVTQTNSIAKLGEFKLWFKKHEGKTPTEYDIDAWKEYRRTLKLANSIYTKFGWEVPECYRFN